MENLLIASRAVHYASTIALAGVLSFLCLVAGPAFRRSANDLAAAWRLRRNLAWLSWTSLVLALVSGTAWLAANSATMSGQPLATALSQGVPILVLRQTQFGHDWLLRLALGMLVGCCMLAQYRQCNWASGAAAWTALTASAAMLATLAWAGHGAVTPAGPGNLHLAADILHLLAAGVWLGTLIPLALLLGEARRIGGAGWTAVALSATRRFSVVAVVSVTVLFAAGLVNTWFLAGTVPALLGTEYGRLLLAKIAIFAAMLLLAAVNLLRLTPRLANRSGPAIAGTLDQLRRNALIEAGCGLVVLAIVAILGILPPGLHAEPGWPLPFRIDPAELTRPAAVLLAALAALCGICVVAIVVAAAAGRRGRIAAPLAGLVFCLAVGWLPLRPAIERAYPTTYYAPAEAYAAPSVARGMRLYAENCALCHGAGGKGDGPAAAGMPVRPADLTAPHLLADPPGDLFWWVSSGRHGGAMPGFAAVLGPDARWDVINFIRARAAGVSAQRAGPEMAPGAAFPVPDFAFEKDGRQQTLASVLKGGPVLLVLFADAAPAARLAQLAAARRRLAAAGLTVLAVDLARPRPKSAEGKPLAAPGVSVSAETASTLALFAGATGDSELLLDRAGEVRAYWTGSSLAGIDVLTVAAERAARFADAPSHAGHAH